MGTKRKSKKQSRRPVLETIEPRILYSADFSPGLLDAGSLATASEQRALEVGGEFTQAAAPDVQQRRRDTEIVFVDVTTPDYDQLVQDIRARGGEREIEVVVLDVRKDGVKQITATLAEREDISALHIISHGADGSIQLGKTSLTFDSLLKNASQIKRWGEALTQGADLLIYGCDVAASTEGKSLIQALSRLTGADVAASEDVTGAAAQGGDWELEYQVGLIETEAPISFSAQLDWSGTLQSVAVGGETRANTTTGGTQQTHASVQPRTVAMDGSGNFVVIWEGSGTGDASGIFGQRYDANGIAQGVEFRVNTTTANTQNDVAVAMDASGNFVVSWTSNGQDGGGLGVYAQRYDAGGVAQGPEFRVNTTTAGDQRAPVIAMNESGTFVIAWASPGQDGSGEGVYAQRFDAVGVAQGSEFRVNSTTANDQWCDSAAMDGAGNFIIAWSSELQDGSGLGVYTRRYDAAGNALTGEVQVNSTTAGDQTWTCVAMNASGDYVVSWNSNGQDGSGEGIYARRYDANGVAQGVEFRVNTTTAGDQATSTIGIDSQGNFVVTWSSFNQDAGGTWGVYKQDYNADGTPFGGETQVNSTTANNQRYAGVAMNGAGQYVVVWSGNGPGDASGVFFQRYASALVVDTTSDTTAGSDTSSISALLANRGADGRISLREAILAANNTPNVGGPDRIHFNVAGAGPHTITLTAALPDVTQALIIDGTTDSDFTGAPIIELRGGGTVGTAFNVAAGGAGSTIRGFIINGFAGDSIVLTGGNNLIAGNYVGTNAFGSAVAATPNAEGGIRILTGSNNNTIGGTTALDRNIFAGNGVGANATDNEISLHGGDNLIIGNYIGVAADGSTVIGNLNDGIDISTGATNNIIGGINTGEGNLIAGHTGGGVRIQNGATGSLVRGNTIWANGSGVSISGSSTGHLIQQNSIYGNTNLGIDLGSDGVTGNDGNKPGGQPNLMMDFPVIASASLSGSTLTVSGHVGSMAGQALFAGARVEFFESPDAAGVNGEGQTYLGFLTADASGNFSGPLSVSGLAGGERITATATDAAGNTSEFGLNATVVDFTASEDFNYASGGAGLSGSGGTGWASAWNNAAAQTLITGAGLTSPGGLLPTNGNGVVFNLGGAFGSTTASRDLSTTLGATSGTLWASFLLTPDNTTGAFDYAGLMLGQAGQQLFVGYTGTNFKMNNAGGGGTNINVGGLVSGQTAFLVLRLDLSASGNDTATLYVNPTTGLPAPDVAGSPAKADLNVGTFDAVSVTGGRGASANASIIDEIRIGSTYASVAPPNQAPAAADVGGSGAEDVASVAVTLSGTDPDGTVQAFRLASLPANGTLYIDAGLTTAAATGTDYSATAQQRTLYFAPSANWSGATSFQYVALDDDGRLDASANTVSVTITALNDAPTITNAATVGLTGTGEDTASGGTTVDSILTAATWADADGGALKGIAVTAVSGNGTWQYSTDGITWTGFGSVSGSSALLLDSASQVRYLPTAQNGETATFSFRAWDQTTGTASINGSPSTANPGAGGGTSAYSSQSASASMVVTSLNDAPVLDNSGTMTFSGITEDDTANGGELVSAIIASAGGDRISDVDSGAVEGIAIAALVSGNGVWEYSIDGGGSWNPVGAVSDNSALLLRAVDRLRFVPDALNADLAIASFRAWDQSSGTQGTKVDVSTNGGSTPFSSAVETASLTVTAVNDAPALADTVVTLNAVNEDAAAPVGAVGTLISVLVSGISDVDSGAVQGIAITAADTANGTWWYSIDNGVSWNALGSPDATNSRLLAADALTRVYFEPAANFSGSIATAITFRAWDRTSGSNGATASTAANGGITPFSAATDTASITVNAVNDAPTITAIADQTIGEDSSTAALAFAIGDTETAAGSLTVTASSSNTTLIPNGNLVLGGAGANRTITVTPAANLFGGPVTITVSVSDGTTSTLETFDVTITPVADTPSVTNASTNEDVQSTSGLVISRNAADGAEVTHFKITGISGGTLYLNDGTTAVGNGTFITFAQGNAGLKFTPSANSIAGGSFDLQASTAANDSGLGGAVVTASIAVTAVNDEPSFTLGGNQTVNEDAGAQTVAAFANPAPGGGADEIGQTFTYTVSNNNNALFSAQPTIDAAGTLSYTSAANASGSATVTVFVTDSGGTANGGDNTSPSQTFTITVNPVADAPIVVLPGAGLAYVEDQAGQLIDAAATVTDAEGDWNGGTLSVQITANAQAADRITILNSGGVSVAVNGTDVLVGATIVGTTAADTATGGNALTITFNAAAAGADVQAVARAIGYYSSSQDPSTAARTVTFTATDAGALAGSATQTVGVTRVNDAPTLTATALNPSFAQGAGAPVSLFSAAAASTIEAGQTLSQLTLTVSNLADGAAERLRIDGTLVGLTNGATATTGTNGYGVSVSVAGSTATVTIVTTGASAVQMQTLVNGLAYHNSSGAPAGGPRTVTLTSHQDSGGTAGGGVDISSLALASMVTVTTSGAIPVAVDDAYSVTEEGSLTVSGVSGWWNTSWQYRRQIAIDNLGRGQLTDFPILIALTAANVDYTQTQNQGQDLRFVDASGALLAHEIESWNETGTSYVWVKVPVVDANSNSDYITMYYGNAAAPDAQNADAVWNASYVGVWHLNQAGSGAANEFRDSSGTGNHGRGGAGVAADTPAQAGGRIGNGQNFDGANDFIEVQNTASLQLSTAMTLEGWVRMDTFGSADVVNALLRKGENNPNNYQLSVGQQTPFFTLDDGENTGVVAPSTVNAAQWYHLSATFDGSARHLYMNGVQVGTDAYSGPIGTDMRDLYIGGRPGTDLTDGVIDEARMSNTARSADWIAAQYANVTSAGYLSFGAQQSATGGGVLFNDSDADGQPLTAVLLAPPSSAAAFTLNADGSFTYTPNADFAGTDTFTYRANDGSNNSNVATVTLTVNPVNDEPSFTLAGNQTVNEDPGAQTVVGFALPSAGGGADETVQTFSYTVSNNNNSLFSVQPTIDASGNLSYTLTANTFGSATVTVFVTDSGGTAGGGDDTSPSQTFTITANPVADTPSVTNATTTEDTQTASGLVIGRNAVDGAEVAHFKITGISGGTLYQNDGTTVISNGDFITVAQGNAGLRFTPSLNSTANGSFQVQGSVANNDAGLGGGTATATITVNPANDAPVVTAGAVTGYVENAPGVAIDNTITIADVDDTQIAGATVTISAGLTAGDVLGFTNTVNITGSYNAGTGVLTLSGTDTLAAYEAALRSVTYSSTSDDPTATSTSRTISWQVTDANSDGTGAQASAVVTSTVNLTALADAPVVTAGALTGYTENAAAVAIDNTITVNDVDDTQIAGATVTISAGLTAGDVLGFTNTANITGSYNAGTGVLTLSGTDTLAAYQAALRSVTYSSTSDDPTATSASRTISWQVTDANSDGTGAQASAVVTSTVNLTALADAPVVTAGALTGYTENAGAVAIDNTITVADVDDTQIAGATVSISAGLTAGDVLGFTNTANITGSYNAGTGVLTLSGTDTLAAYETALRSVTYSSTSEDPTVTSASRTIGWQVTDANSDGTGAQASAVVTSTVNITALADAPVVTAGAVTGYTENAAAVAIDNTITVSDVDDTQIAGATVSISAGLTAGDVLGFTNTANITGSYNAGTGVLTLSGTDTLAAYQAALRSVTYSSTSEDPTVTSASRTIGWQVTDANSDGTGAQSSAVVTSTVNLTALADAPVVTAGALTGYTENAAAVAIDNTITVNDVDDTQIAGATVTISAGLTAGDVLGFTNTANITGSYNAGTGVLTLSGTDTLAAYQAALRSVTYSSTSEDPTVTSASRTIGWQVTDANSDGTGAQASAVVTSTMNLTALADAPVVTAGAVTGYTENAAAVAIDNTITVADVDDTQIAGATVSISAGLTAGDVLGFTNTANITGSYNAGTGVLTLSGTDTLAAYETALRSVTYSSTSEDPTVTSASRTIGWQVTDANSDGTGAQSSAVVTSTVNLTALADAPVVTAGALTGYTENAAAVAIDNTITIADVDDTQIAGATVTISAGLTAGDVLGFTNTANITGSYNAGTGVLTLSGTDTLAAYQAALRSVTYSSTSEDPTVTSASRTIGWQVTDANSDGTGAQASAVVTSTMNLTALADAPVVTAGAVTGYTENAAAVAIDNTITVNDVDDTQIAGATVSISAGLTAGDVLGFTNTANITGSYNAGTGVLTLSGTDTLAAYQAALRSVTYSSTSDDPTATSASRTISWQVTDANSDGTGAQASAVVTSTVNLTALADAPVVTAGALTGYTENAGAVAIDNTITVADVDDTQIAGATVSISAGLTAGDVLGFTNTANITGSYNAGTGVLTLSGTDTLAAYETALRSVTYSSTSEDPTVTSASRTIGWQVTDANSDGTGAQASAVVTSTVNITALADAPVVTAGAVTGYTENAAAVAIDNTITVSDVDDTQIAGATVSISAGLTAGDVLGFTNTANITGSYNAGTGVLTLSGTDTLAAYEAALRSVSYSSGSDDPTASSASRTISWQVTDANSDMAGAATSAAIASMMNVTAVNDAPVLGANALTIDQGASALFNASILSASDVDNPAGALSFLVGNVTSGQFELTSAPGVAITSFTQAEVLAGQVRFVHDGTPTVPGYDVRVSDGALTIGPFAASVTFNPVPLTVSTPPSVPPPPPPPFVIDPAPAPAPEPVADTVPATGEPGDALMGSGFSPGRPLANFNDLTEISVRLAAAEARVPLKVAPPPESNPNRYEARPSVEPQVELLNMLPAELSFTPSMPVDWLVTSAFGEGAEEQIRSELEVLLDSVKFGGMALSVGVVWWASRISGLLGTLIASTPAWRHIDPLPVLGRDDRDEDKWYAPDDNEADANELAVSLVLDGGRRAADDSDE